MRSNGLTASAYTPIADIEPSLVGTLLDELKGRGVAAYVTPVEPTSMAGLERPEFRTEVRDRLFVDAASAETARELLSEVNDAVDTTGEDLAWAQIVSGYDQPVAGATSWPASEELTDGDAPDSALAEGGAGADGDEAGYVDQPRRRTPADIIDARGILSGPPPREDDEHDRFVPPTPPPLPRLEPRQQLAWLGVVGGPLLLLVAVLFGIHLPGWVSALAVTGFVGGFVGLVVMMGGDDNDEDSGWDNGAVV
jgi:hypothetical protein